MTFIDANIVGEEIDCVKIYQALFKNFSKKDLTNSIELWYYLRQFIVNKILCSSRGVEGPAL